MDHRLRERSNYSLFFSIANFSIVVAAVKLIAVSIEMVHCSVRS
jgi:hypothetical protein